MKDSFGRRSAFFLVSLSTILLTGMIPAHQDMSQRSRPGMNDGAPKKGEKAPLFKPNRHFVTEDNVPLVDLNAIVGQKPVVLIFGSYT